MTVGDDIERILSMQYHTAAFDYDYGGLSNAESRLLKAYSNLLCVFVSSVDMRNLYGHFHSIDTALHPSKWLILYRSLWHYLPNFLLRIVQYTPIKEHNRTRHTAKIVHGIGKELFSEKTKEVLTSDKAATHKDVMSILSEYDVMSFNSAPSILTQGMIAPVKANSSENPKTQLNEEEMIAQMQTLTFAGHETTASTLSWMLYELSKHPDYQAKMRTEIKAARQAMHARGDDRFSMEDLDSMTTVMNAIKVCRGGGYRCPQSLRWLTGCTLRKRCASIPSSSTCSVTRSRMTSCRCPNPLSLPRAKKSTQFLSKPDNASSLRWLVTTGPFLPSVRVFRVVDILRVDFGPYGVRIPTNGIPIVSCGSTQPSRSGLVCLAICEYIRPLELHDDLHCRQDDFL